VPRDCKDIPLVTIIELADGRSIAAATDFFSETVYWVICRIEEIAPIAPDRLDRRFRLADQPGDVPVCGTSLALLLDAALDSGGDISHLETGRLNQLDDAQP
jgi:hypothetical protein